MFRLVRPAGWLCLCCAAHPISLGIRVALLQALNFVSVVATALMLWKGISLLTNTESPIVVVLSGSMEPAFQRGDLLFLALPPKQPLRTGDITVYNVGSEIPIVHRVIEVHDEYVAAAAVAAFVVV